ncbi:formylglycine-generating enzyme family protein [Amphritea pacifica]|uniref:SUMF1/EgtB/PvdO family nonheme iron enzyme n=1 Tax=Amphritea pacifica TaxID=2811233 RepID=A0ABS2W8J6_9GAMM|nr:SUMF1/EgtB/PvdO family nonheme iron enzyme [Amphritea pacifica]MBN0988038.1 SUMF1/EgtB/PvdO family nonheme iron enzyme [Amphritea pacifica]
MILGVMDPGNKDESMPTLTRLFQSVSFISLTSVLILSGCNGEADIVVTSDVVSAEKIAQIRANIQTLHPDADSELQAKVLDTAVRAVEDMVFIEGGKFMMGDFGMPCDADPERPVWRETENMCNASRWADTSPAHPVELDSYSLSKYETRVKDMDVYFLAHKEPLTGADWREEQPDHEAFRPNLPAGTRTWDDAKNYCVWLGKVTGYAFDLPTEAQWEFAARNRGQNIYYATDNGFLESPRNTKPYDRDSGKLKNTYPVDLLPPNPLGIFGMQNNAAEWVNDWYDPEYYAYSPGENPSGPGNAIELTLNNNQPQSYHLLRGGVATEKNSNVLIRRAIGDLGDSPYNPWFGVRCSIKSSMKVN